MADEPVATPAEYSGRTVEEAITRALSELNLRRDQAEITVISEGRPGILGVGAQPARVQVAPRPQPAPAARGFADEAPAPARPFLDAEEAEEDVALEPEAFEDEDEDEDVDDEDELEDEELEDDEEYDEEGEAVAPLAVSAPVQRERAPRQPRPAGDVALASDSAVDVLETLLQLMGFDAQVTAREPVTPGDGVGMIAAVLDVQGAPGEEMGLLIGRKGETLAALQYVLNLIVNHQTNAHATFGIDVEGYRQRREAQLEDLARRVAERVRRSGEPMTLEPMPPAERRIVHITLADDPDVQTVSIGEGDARKVAITRRS
jgi:spoIIIJ-associated protein